MKNVAIVLNVVAVILCFVFFITADFRNRADEGALPGMIILLIVVAVNFVAILWKSESVNWLGLYFKRKRLEEQQKIDALSKKGEQD